MNRLIKYFAKDKLVVNLIVIAVIAFGLNGLRKIKREAMPSTAIDKMMVVIAYPGASARDVELNVIAPIEEELREITGISKFTSVSIEDGGRVDIELDQEAKDKQSIKDEIYRKTSNGYIKEIPVEVDSIQVIDLNPKLRAVYSIALSPKSQTTGKKQLFKTADILEDLLSRVEGVSDVSLNGYLEREIKIKVDPLKMSRDYISLNEIVSSIKTRNVRSTGGTLQGLQREETILTIGQFENPLDVKEVIIRSGFEQRRIRIKDVARVEDGFEKESILVRVNKMGSVVLKVRRKENADTIQTVDNIKQFLQKNKNIYEKDFTLTVVSDDSQNISSLLSVVTSNAVLGFILVLIVLFIFLDLRTSFWTAFSIPFCILAVIAFMDAFDISLNMLTLGAIITVLGMMVDDAIVVAETIYEKKSQGMPPLDAAVSGLKEVIAPVSVTILSTILAFMPLLTIKGVMGKFIYVYPIIIAATLLVSLFESIFILPNHLATKETKPKPEKQWFLKLAAAYEKSLKFCLRRPWPVVAAFILIFGMTLLFSRDTLSGFVMMWDDSSEQFLVNLEAPAGTSLKKMEEYTKEVEDILTRKIPKKELVSLYTQVGTHGGRLAKTSYQHWATVQVQLLPKTDRDRTAAEIMDGLRKDLTLKALPKFTKITLEEEKPGPPVGAPVDVKIVTDNPEHRAAALTRIQKYLNQLPGVKDVDHDQKKGKKELKLVFDYDRMAQMNLNVETTASTVRIAYEGVVAASIRTAGEKLEFRVQIQDSFQRSKTFLLSLLVPNSQGQLIPLKNFAKIKVTDGSAAVNRYNGRRAATISADVDPEIITPAIAAQKLKTEFAGLGREFPGLYLKFEGEAMESKAALADLAFAFLITLLMIYFLLVFLFRSTFQPLIVMSVIPFGVTGVLIAFTLHGIPLSFMGIIGVIGLSGIVVNDSIIMVTFINSVFKKSRPGESIPEQISAGARLRLRPVLITTLTTVAGLLPTVYGIGGQARSLVPTVMAMSYGLLFATLLTLFLIPTLYSISLKVKKTGSP